MLVTLGENNIKNLNDLADLASDELRELFSHLTEAEANEMIMEARKSWFKGTSKP